MSARWAGAVGGFGDGIAQVGAMWEREDIRMQELAARSAEMKERRLEEIRLSHENRLELAKASAAARAPAGGGGKGGIAAVMAAGGQPSDVGLNFTPTDRAGFEQPNFVREDTQPDVINDGGYSDAITRKLNRDADPVTQKGVIFDAMAFDKAERQRIDNNVNQAVKLEDPGQYKSMQEGIQQESISRLVKVLDGVEDPKTREKLKAEIADLRAATDKGDRFKVADGTLVNEATGENSPTAVGKAKIARDYADASKATAGRHDEALKALTQERLATSASLNEASRELSTLRSAVDKQSSKTMGDYTASVKAAETRVSELRQREDELYKRLNSYTVGAVAKKGQPGAAGITPVKDNGSSMPAPKSKAERDKLAPGTRYQAPDGSIRIR